MKNNVDNKASVDLHCMLRTFNVGDYVMIHLKLEQFTPKIVNKLHT